MLGSGDSDRPADEPLGLVAQAGYLAELVRALDVERFAVIGHSVGGGVAQLLALDHPGVDAMVLMSSTAFDAWPTLLTREIQRTPPDQEVELFVHSGMRASLRIGMADPDRLTPDQVAEYLRPWSGPEGVASFFRFARAMDGTGLVGRDDDLRALEIPVLIFWGEEDEFYPPAVAERSERDHPDVDARPAPGMPPLPGGGRDRDARPDDLRVPARPVPPRATRRA